jgi:ATP-dependent exoDNAse (exonuclease V) beta subunit
VLYVALTRAEEQLYIISSKNLSSKGEIPKNNMCSFFINYLIALGLYKEIISEYELGNSAKLSSKEKHEDTSKIIPNVVDVLNPKNIKIAQRESVMWGTHQQEAIEYGNLIHEILSFVKTKQDVDLAITKALENGLIVLSQKEIVCQTIMEIVEHKDLLNHFAEVNIVMNEQTIIQKEARTIKPDRMAIDKYKNVFLLDYKTGAPNSKYGQQLENYQKAIEAMGFTVVEKALVYIGKKVMVFKF